MYSKEGGQSLLELIVVLTIAAIVVGALTFAIIGAIRNASFAKSQAEATKYAQDGIEKLRSIRDRNTAIGSSISGINTFSDLYSLNLSHNYCNTTAGDGPCYFYLNVSGILTQGTQPSMEKIGQFTRQFLISDDQTSYASVKTISTTVVWTDFSGSHQSKLTTILRKL